MKSANYKIDERKLGVIGFSGGGSLAIYLSLNEKREIKPDFAAFIYTVYNPKVHPQFRTFEVVNECIEATFKISRHSYSINCALALIITFTGSGIIIFTIK